MYVAIGIVLGVACVAFGIYRQIKKEKDQDLKRQVELTLKGICYICGAKPKNLQDHQRRNRCKAVLDRKNNKMRI